MITKKLFGIGLAACLAGALPAETIYRNDFSVRTSKLPVPLESDWVRYDYTPGGSLAYTYGKQNLAYTENMPWTDPSQMQDGWIHGAYARQHPVAFVTNNVDSDTERPFAAFDSSNSSYTGTLYQAVGNAFSNGTLTIWIDMRSPSSWGGQKIFRFFPAFRTYLENPEGISNPVKYPAVCGLQNACVRFFGFSNSAGGASSLAGDFYNSSLSIPLGRWVRYRMTLYLDTKKVDCSVWQLGDTVPTWDTAVTDEGLHKTGARFYRYITNETGPIAGLGLYVSGVDSDGTVAKMAAFTNIRLEWQAPGSSISVPCYSNNFVTCWKRRLTPGAETSHTYEAATSSVVTNSYNPTSVYHMAYNQSQYARLTPPASSTRAVGVDDWKRCDADGGSVYVGGTKDLTNTNFIKMCCYTNENAAIVGGAYVVLSQTLGQKITSGKVRISVDGRSPGQWATSGSRHLCVGLGSDDLYSTATTENYGDYCMAKIGVFASGTSNAKKPNPVHYDQDGETIDSTTNFTLRTWQRYVITADLDNKTYDWAIYEIGGGSADKPNPEPPSSSGTGVSFINDVSDIASFVLFGSGFERSSTFNNHILFDNIQVWKNWDDATQTGDLIYFNDFKKRRRVVTVDARPLTGKSNVEKPEHDFWVRRGSCDGFLSIIGDANPAVSLDGDGEKLAFHSLGLRPPFSTSRMTVTRIDVRPPDFWYGEGRKHAQVVLGGEDATQGDMFAGADPLAKAPIRFGFVQSGTDKDTCGRYANTVAFAVNGSFDETASFAVDTSSWYRFVVRTRPADGTYDLDIYRQGAHPGIDDANGTPVASYSGLAYSDGADRELTSIGIASSGMRGFSPQLAEDPGSAMFDNIAVDSVPVGTAFTIR